MIKASMTIYDRDGHPDELAGVGETKEEEMGVNKSSTKATHLEASFCCGCGPDRLRARSRTHSTARRDLLEPRFRRLVGHHFAHTAARSLRSRACCSLPPRPPLVRRDCAVQSTAEVERERERGAAVLERDADIYEQKRVMNETKRRRSGKHPPGATYRGVAITFLCFANTCTYLWKGPIVEVLLTRR